MSAHKSQCVTPKVKITTNGNRNLSLEQIHMQFPICLAYSMTIKESQGQSLRFVGEGISHGQLQSVDKSLRDRRRPDRRLHIHELFFLRLTAMNLELPLAKANHDAKDYFQPSGTHRRREGDDISLFLTPYNLFVLLLRSYVVHGQR